MHVKAFGLMTRHPVKLEQVPPDLREGLPVDARGRVDRPPREARAAVFREFLSALTPLRESGKLGGILFQMPPYVVWKPSSLDYLEWARDQVGADEFLFEPRHRSWFADDIRDELLRWLEERRMSWVVVDAPKVDAGNVPATLVAATTPIAYVRFHGRNAATWNTRGGSAAHRFDYLYSEDELREWIAAAARAVEPGGAGIRVLQQQQPDGRRRPGRRPARSCCASCSRRKRCRRHDRALGHARPARATRALRRRDRRRGPRAAAVGHPRAGGAAAGGLRRRARLRRQAERRRGSRVPLAARGVRGAASLGRRRHAAARRLPRRADARARARRRRRPRPARRRSPASTRPS